MIRSAVTMLWLAGVWVALWGELTWANALGGLGVAAAVAMLLPPHRPGPPVGTRPLVAVHLVLYVLWKMMEASVSVALEVLRPRRARGAIIGVPIRGVSPAVISASCICIGLTPGTMVLEIAEDPPVLYVHILRTSSIEKARADVIRLETLIETALPTGAAVGRRP